MVCMKELSLISFLLLLYTKFIAAKSMYNSNCELANSAFYDKLLKMSINQRTLQTASIYDTLIAQKMVQL